MLGAPRHAGRVCAAGALAAWACGGKPPAEEPAPEVSAVPLTRVPVEEDEDGVEIVSGKGHVEPATVEAALAPRRAALTACYLEKLGRRRWLGGQLTLRWEIAADGTVTRVLLADNDVGAWPIEKCLLDIARDMTFGTPVGGAAEVSLPLVFTAPRTPAAWDEDEAMKAVGAQLGKLDACARDDAPAPDEVVITAYVGPHGRVQSVGFGSATAAIDDAWAACAERSVRAWRLPDPKGQVTKLAVRYGPRTWTSSPPKNST
jgi:hypothetical protein